MKSFFFWLSQEVSTFTWIVAILLDLSWTVVDLSIFSVIGFICYPFLMAGIFSICFLAVTLIQHFHAAEEWTPAMQKGVFFAVLAALPFSLISIFLGLLTWGFKRRTDPDHAYEIGRVNLNYRELEKTLKSAAIRTGRLNGNEVDMRDVIDALKQAGKLSGQEAEQLHELRKARNGVAHKTTPPNLLFLVKQSERLLEKYRERFGVV